MAAALMSPDLTEISDPKGIEHGAQFCYVTEASSVGFAPGYWPEIVFTDLGDDQLMHRVSKKLSAEGEIVYVRYSKVIGPGHRIDVLVYND